MSTSDSEVLPWQHYFKLIVEFLVTFCLASFCMAMFFTHQGANSIPLSIFLILLYLFVIGGCFYKLLKNFPIALLMLMIPLIPLVPMVLVLVFMPLIQKL